MSWRSSSTTRQPSSSRAPPTARRRATRHQARLRCRRRRRMTSGRPPSSTRRSARCRCRAGWPAGDRRRFGGHDRPASTARSAAPRCPRGHSFGGPDRAPGGRTGRRAGGDTARQRRLMGGRAWPNGPPARTNRAWPCLTLVRTRDYPRPSFAPAKQPRERGRGLAERGSPASKPLGSPDRDPRRRTAVPHRTRTGRTGRVHPPPR